MTALKTLESDAVDNLAALVTEAATGIKHVYKSIPDSIDVPALLISDAVGDRDLGLHEKRLGQWREVSWDLELTGYVAISPTLSKASNLARKIAADLVDQLGTDITLGGTVHDTYWRTPVRLTALAWGGEPEQGGKLFVGFTGIYTLVFKEARSFA